MKCFQTDVDVDKFFLFWYLELVTKCVRVFQLQFIHLYMYSYSGTYTYKRIRNLVKKSMKQNLECRDKIFEECSRQHKEGTNNKYEN
jgi:hypothetical protein